MRPSDPLSGRRYRKVTSSVCEGGVDLRQSPAQLQCPLMPPRGLQISIRGEAVAVRPGEDVLFVVRQEKVSGPPAVQCACAVSPPSLPNGVEGGRAAVGRKFLPGPGQRRTMTETHR